MTAPGTESPSRPGLADLAGGLAATALANVRREYPYAPQHLVQGPDDRALPRERHPAFYGAYDWHSAVHMHWLLVKLLREHPSQIPVEEVRDVLGEHLAPAPLAIEAAYLSSAPSFERPYGWAWACLLAAECEGWATDPDIRADPDATLELAAAAASWATALRPVVDAITELVADWLPRAAHPMREGTHPNSAFGLGMLLDAAGTLQRAELDAAIRGRASAWYLGDRDAPASWEPSGQDFLSPSLCEADLVRRLLPASEFPDWLSGFLPGLDAGRPESLLHPVPVPDRTDGQIGHLDGLNLSRAAMLRTIARALPDEDPRRPMLRAAAERHLDTALPALTEEGYLSSHWLGSFAALALSAG